MRHFLRDLAFGTLLLAAAAGCTSRYRACPPSGLTRESGLVQLGAVDDRGAAEAELIRSFADSRRTCNASGEGVRSRKFLALSGGGMYGAYTVGVLSGWSTTGTRPVFDVVTGVSTGALIATHAFLGTEYDAAIIQLYTSVTNRDIYTRRPTAIVLWTDSAASSAPLRKLIDTQVDDAMIAAVARAHAAGRRLYIGTTNIDTRRLVIWDMGALASSGKPDAKELYRKVLLASASVPGFFPPVAIDVEINGRCYTEMHVDGATSAGVFLPASVLPIDPSLLKSGQQPLAGSDAYVIVAGKLYADPACTARRTVKIGQSALNSLVYAQTRGDLFRIYSLCLLGGMNYHLAALPETAKASGNGMAFDPEEMRRLYEGGYAAATGGFAWRDTPPGAEPEEQSRPRTTTQFLAPGSNSR